MMRIRGIILCEGETDQALLGYYMMGISDWKYKYDKSKLPFPQETINWFKDGQGNVLGIWAVGGNDFSSELEMIMDSEMVEHTIDRIVVVTDHDDVDAEESRSYKLRDVVKDSLSLDNDIDILWENNAWTEIKYRNSLGEYIINICYLLVPAEEEGALETFMLNALCENEEEKNNVISQVRDFLSGFASEKYLKKRREKIKAELGVSISIMNPDRVFTIMNELLESVSWEKFDTANKQFSVLKDI